MSRIRMKQKQIEIERNIVEKFLLVLKDIIKKNRKVVLYSTLGIFVVLVAVIVSSIVYENIRIEERASFDTFLDEYNAVQRTGNNEKLLQTVHEFKNFVDSATIDSTQELGYYVLGNMYFTQKEYSEAKKYLVKFVDEAPESELTPIALLKAAVASEEMGDIEGAFEMYRTLENDYIDSVIGDQIYYHLAGYYMKKNDIRSATQYYIKEIAKHPKSHYSLLAKKRLFLLRNK